MAYIYAYAYDEADCSTIGRVGALLDEGATFSLMAGEFGELTFTHPVDPYGKWRALVNGAILKTMVPMRVCPGMRDDGTYVGSVDRYVVAAASTRNQRYIYSKPVPDSGDKKKKRLKVGQAVTVTGVVDADDDLSRYRVTVGSGKAKVSGYMARAGLTLVRSGIPVEADGGGMEAVEASYAVRQQLFRIYAVEPESGAGGGAITVRARRIVYDLLGNLTTYRINGGVTCLAACRGILDGALMPHDFSIHTDIGDSRIAFDSKDKNPIEALIDPEEGVAARWGAEVVSDDYEIYVLRRAGIDRGIRIEYGKNLIGVDVRVDATDAANAVRPIGEKKDGTGLYLDGRAVNGRHGYNYNTATRTCADWLPEGYAFYEAPDGTLEGSVVVRANRGEGALPRIAALPVEGAKVEKGSDDVTTAVARRMLAEAAVAAFEGGCDVEAISMDVDFIMLGDTDEYAQYRHLEPLFVYDAVHIRDRRVGVSADVDLTSIEWNVRGERVASAKFGALKDLTATVSAWQIPGISGQKLAPGSVGAGQIAADAVSANHLQANSVNAEAIQAGSVTAQKLAAGAVTAQSIAAVTAAINSITASTISTDALAAAFASLFSVVADNITAGTVTADALDAVMASLVTASVGVLDVDFAHVKDLAADEAIIRSGEAGALFIDRLSVTSANLVNAVISRLILVDDDGEGGLDYYAVNVGSGGTIELEEIELTAEEIAAGETGDGRPILEDTVVAENISGTNIYGGSAVIADILTDALNAGHITATEALIASARIPALYTTAVTALENSLNFYSKESINLTVNNLQNHIDRLVRVDAEGLHVGDSQQSSEVLIDSGSVNVVLGNVRYSKFASDYVQFGDYQLRRTADGGLAFKKV